VDGAQSSSNPLSMLASGFIDNTYQQQDQQSNDTFGATQSSQSGYFHQPRVTGGDNMSESFLYHNSLSTGNFSQLSVGNTSTFSSHHQVPNQTSEVSLTVIDLINCLLVLLNILFT